MTGLDIAVTILCDSIFILNVLSYHFLVTVQVGNQCTDGQAVSDYFNFLPKKKKNPVFSIFLSFIPWKCLDVQNSVTMI